MKVFWLSSFIAVLALAMMSSALAGQQSDRQRARALEARIRELNASIERIEAWKTGHLRGGIIFVDVSKDPKKKTMLPILRKEFEERVAIMLLTGEFHKNFGKGTLAEQEKDDEEAKKRAEGFVRRMLQESKSFVEATLDSQRRLLQTALEGAQTEHKRLVEKIQGEQQGATGFAGTWIGSSGKGGFDEEWKISGSGDGPYSVQITYSRDGATLGPASGSGRVVNGKLEFTAQMGRKPRPDWATSTQISATVSGNTLTFTWKNEHGSGTVVHRRKG